MARPGNTGSRKAAVKTASRKVLRSKGRAARKASGAQTPAAILRKELPEFKLVKAVRVVNIEGSDAAVRGVKKLKTAKGPSIKALRNKFLSQGADAQDGGSPFSPVDDSVVTKQIAPKKGGPAKTADFKDGKVTIVQG